MSSSQQAAALAARRALLRQQVECIGDLLPWLTDPARIPVEALGYAAMQADPARRCFGLATWLLVEVVTAADRVRDHLDWDDTFDRCNVPAALRPRVVQSVLQPTSRYAPGIFAMAEIVAAVPPLAVRGGVPAEAWCGIALASERFAACLSSNGTDLQVVVRDYLRAPIDPNDADRRVLDARRLRLDDVTGITSVTPIDDLLAAAGASVKRNIGPPKGICVAMMAKAPSTRQVVAMPPTMYGAIWSAFVRAAARLIYPHYLVDRRDVDVQADPDRDFMSAIEALAAQRAVALRLGRPAQTWREATDAGRALLEDAAVQRSETATPMQTTVQALFGLTQEGLGHKIVEDDDRGIRGGERPDEGVQAHEPGIGDVEQEKSAEHGNRHGVRREQN